MRFFESLLRVFDAEMETPGLYGWFHLLFFALSILTAVGLCFLYKKTHSHKLTFWVIFGTALLVAFLELYKQINFGFSYENGIQFDYAWYAFPFQFCSTPMYVGLLAGIFRRGRIHNALAAYLATYAMFAGLCVMFYPGDVFISTIGINIQTMICHGSMITVGIYLMVTDHVKLEHKTILKAIPVFAAAVAIAMVMNEIAYRTGLLATDTFNMFYISPYCDPHLPVFSLVQPLLPFVLEIVVYIAGFSLASYVILLAAMGIKTLAAKKTPAHI